MKGLKGGRGRADRHDRASPKVSLAVRWTFEITKSSIREVIPACSIVQLSFTCLAVWTLAGSRQGDGSGIGSIVWCDDQVCVWTNGRVLKHLVSAHHLPYMKACFAHRNESIGGFKASTDPTEALQYTSYALLQVQRTKVDTTDVTVGGELAYHLYGKIHAIVLDLRIIMLKARGRFDHSNAQGDAAYS